MFNAVIALVIATTKAILVILFFMHVKYSGKHIALVILSGFFFPLTAAFGFFGGAAEASGQKCRMHPIAIAIVAIARAFGM